MHFLGTVVVQSTNGDYTLVIADAVTGFCAIVASCGAAFISYRGLKAARGAERHARQADHAVNGAPDGDPTIRESVNELKAGVTVLQEGQQTIHHRAERLETNLDAVVSQVKRVGGEVSGIATRQKAIESRLDDRAATVKVDLDTAAATVKSDLAIHDAGA